MKGLATVLMAVMMTVAPPTSSHSEERMDGAATTSLDVFAEFASAALVTFRHDSFNVPDMDALYAATHEMIRRSSLTIHGAPGEFAQVSCEIQVLERKRVETYIPVSSESCIDGSQTVQTGTTVSEDIELTTARQGSDDMQNRTHYVSLEVSYI